MKHSIILCIFLIPLILEAQSNCNRLSSSVLTIGIYDRTKCGIVTDNTRDFTDDNEIAEAVMDSTGVSELGTGFIYEYKHKKYIITCDHVLYKAGRIVGFAASSAYKDGSEFELELLGTDMFYDIAVLEFKYKKDATQFKALSLVDSLTEFNNEIVQFVGFWQVDGIENSKEGQFLYRKNQDLRQGLAGIRYLESNVYIPGGFSGGPVLNQENEVVGMNIARNNIKETSYSLGSPTVKRLVHEIINYGTVRRIFSGIEFSQDTVEGTILVNKIIPGSPAAKRYEELIQKEVARVNGNPVSTIHDILLNMEEVNFDDKMMTIGLANGHDISILTEPLNENNLEKLAKHAILQYGNPQKDSDINVTVDKYNTLRVESKMEGYFIKTAGTIEDKIYCINNLAQLGIIIRISALNGYLEMGKDDGHIFIKELKFSKNKNSRILYY